MHEWPVLIFTLLIQSSVGLSVIFIYLLLTKHFVDTHGNLTVTTLAKPLSFAVILALLGLLISFGHLGYPLNAPHAIRHITTSWLSREILLSSAYLGLLSLVVLALYYNKFVHYVLPVLVVAGIIGVMNIYCMAYVYRSTSIVTWTSVNTHFLFFGTSLFIGGILVISWIQSRFSVSSPLYKFAQRLVIIMVIFSFLQLLFLPAYMTYIQTHPYNDIVTFPIDSVTVFLENMHLQYYRFICLAAGLGLAIWAIFKKRFHPAAYLACAILIIGEVIGRYAFYNIYA